jgi:hypothetical protein
MRAAGDRVLEALAIRPGERSAIGWLFLHSLFLGIYVAFFFSTANAWFLERFGPSALSWAYIASGVVGFGTIALFAWLQRRLAPVTVLVSALGFLVLLTGGLWLAALLTGASWVAFAMFIWIFPALSLLNLEFWGLAGMLFDLRQGKRLFGLLGTGEVISALVGFLLVPLLLELLSRPIELLPLAAIGLLASMLIVRLMAPRFAAQLGGRPEPGAAEAPEAVPALLGDRYFVLIAALIGLALVAGYFVDFGFLTQVRERFADSASIARFIAVFFALVKILELGMKGFLAGRLVSWLGLGFGLMMLPAALLLSAGGAALAGSLLGAKYAVFFLLVALTKLLWLVLKKSIFDPAFKVLYQPLPRERRLAFQTRVEGFVQQGGVVAVGLFLLAFTRWGPGGALPLFYLLLPLLGLWLGAAVLVYRAYRSRLIEALQGQPAPADERAIEEPILEALAGAPPEAADEELRLLCRVRPTLAARLWGPLIARGSPEVRRAALRLIGQIRAGEVRETVAALAADPAEPLRELAEAALRDLDEVEEVARSPERLDALAESAEVEERRLAAVAAACDPPRVQVLNQLLWDRDPGVRRTALLAAGRTGDPSFVPRIVANLAIPAFSATAAAAAVEIGEPILGELEAAFKRAGDDLELRGRILSIYEEIGGPAAGAAIFDKLDFPHGWIQQRALAALGRFPLPDDPERSGRIGRWIERSAEVAAWDLAALVDLAGTPEAAAVCASLKREVHRTREFLFELLELLCDRRAIRLVRQHLERGGQEASVYALEIADLVIPPALKPIVLPLFEPLTPAQCLRRLEHAFPQPRIKPEERLRALAHRDYSRIGLWTKACALEALAAVSDGRVPDDLVAHLFNPEPLLQEIAAWSIYRIDPAAYARHSAKLFRDRGRLDRLLDVDRVREPGGAEADDDGPSADRFLFGRLRFLTEVPEFSVLEAESLVKLAAVCEPRGLRAAAELPSPENPTSYAYLVMDGVLEAAEESNGGAPVELRRGSVVPLGARRTLRTRQGALLLRVGQEQVLQLLGDHPLLLPPFLRVLGSGRTGTAGRGLEGRGSG